jgi:nucleoid-associated protein YgaU
MHTDYKVGILIGVVVLAVGGAYMLLRSPEEVVTETPTIEETTRVTLETDGGPMEIDLSDEVDSDAMGSADLITVGDADLVLADDDALVVPTLSADETPDAADITPGTPDAIDLVVVGPGVTDDPTPTPTIDETALSPEDDETVVVMDTGVDVAVPVPGVGVLSEDDPTVVVDPGVITPVGGVSQSGSTYRVQKGDDGYWTIAEKVWGEGKGRHWKKIQDANPGVVSTSLAVGMVLKIPALEEATGTTAVAGTTVAAGGAPKPGSTFINSAGQKVYVVSKDDSAGLWGISAKMYDKGHMWRTIANANPTAKPTALKVGQHLVIPTKPTTTRTTPMVIDTVATSTGGTISTDGVEYYVVTKEDSSGMWGIAEKLYGHGKYHTLLQKANPNVNSNALRVGQRLVKPAKPVE